jgi:hypothetical protein
MPEVITPTTHNLPVTGSPAVTGPFSATASDLPVNRTRPWAVVEGCAWFEDDDVAVWVVTADTTDILATTIRHFAYVEAIEEAGDPANAYFGRAMLAEAVDA